MSRTTIGLYEFGPFTLDIDRRVLTRDGQALPLAPKTFDLLVVLVQSSGRALSKRELMTALWPETFVEEANLSFQISTLRKVLGDEAAQWIETLPKHGYRFTADVRTTASRSTPAVAVEAGHPDQATSAASITPGRRPWLWLSVAIGTGALLTIVWYFTGARDPQPAAITSTSAPAVPLTAYPGFELTPSLSPDGSQVAFAWNGQALNNYDIYVKVAGPGEHVRLTTHPAGDESPAWSPDGRFIAFLRIRPPPAGRDLIVIPALGGAERTVATIFPPRMVNPPRTLSNVSWTPDGRWLAVGGALSPNGLRGIWLISVNGTEQRRLTDDASAPGVFDLGPAVSSDGRHVAFLRRHTTGRPALYLLSMTSDWRPDGAPRLLTTGDSGVLGFAWTPDGRDLVFSFGGHLGLTRTARIRVAPQPGPPAEPESLPFGEQATSISISSKGRLVYAAQSRDTALYELALRGPSSRPIALAALASTFDEHTPHYSPDGKRLVFTSTRSGSEELWIANRDGSNLLQVTSMGGPQCGNAQWSPDGRTILFNSRPSGSAHLYLLDPGSGKVTQLSNDPGDEVEARWSRDGRSIYFASTRSGQLQVWRMPAAGGAPTQVTYQGGVAAVEAGDGFVYYSKSATSPTSIWRVPVGGGAEVQVADGLSYSLNFVAGERGLYFIAAGQTEDTASIDFFDFSSQRRSTLARLDKPFWYGLALSSDERSLLFPMVDSAGSNLMLVDRFR